MADPNLVDTSGTRRQLEIYKWGLLGKKPGQAVSVDELERQARAVLRPEVYDYVAGGAGAEETIRANANAFRRWRIVPRMLRDVSRRDAGVVVLGRALPAPLMLAPIGVLSILHKKAEGAAARAAASLGIPFVLSTISSTTIEDSTLR